ncbi:MAG: hypothetical protein C4306_09960 [Thermoleophilia bacterium]
MAVMLIPLSWSVRRVLAQEDAGVDASSSSVWRARRLYGGRIGAGPVLGRNRDRPLGSRRQRPRGASEGSGSPRARASPRAGTRVAHRCRDLAIEEVLVEQVAVGDVLVVPTGEVVPGNGTRSQSQASLVESSREASLVESALTGESLPIVRPRDALTRSSTTNTGDEVAGVEDHRPVAEQAQRGHAAAGPDHHDEVVPAEELSCGHDDQRSRARGIGSTLTARRRRPAASGAWPTAEGRERLGPGRRSSPAPWRAATPPGAPDS